MSLIVFLHVWLVSCCARRDSRTHFLELFRMNINIYLIKRCEMRPSVENPMRDELAAHFESVRSRTPRWASDYNIAIRLQRTCPLSIAIADVVVYLVQNPTDSVFARFGVAAHPSGHGGRTCYTIPGRLRASEVYVRSEFGSLLAKVVFHEVLHNKTGWGNSRLHGHHHGGVSAASIRHDTVVSDEDLDLMGTHVGAAHPQWTGGCSP